jgi:demethylmenaquinone methyltransferase / 2-methoxy-6-polyprenyl-1,4-benzoquinol methylase
MMQAPAPAPPRDGVPAPDDQRAPVIRSMFAQITPTYDRLNLVLSGAIDRYWRRRTAGLLIEGLAPRPRILDVATGTGDLARAIRKRAGEGARVVGLDFTRPMLERAQRKFPDAAHRWVEADGLALPCAGAVFDACSIAFGLRNMADKPAALREMRRILRPGGRLGILEFYEPPNPLIRRLYHFYSFQVMPRVGRWLSGSDAYGYLTGSIRAYWALDEAVRQVEAAGFVNVRSVPMTFGVAVLILGEVPQES